MHSRMVQWVVMGLLVVGLFTSGCSLDPETVKNAAADSVDSFLSNVTTDLVGNWVSEIFNIDNGATTSNGP